MNSAKSCIAHTPFLVWWTSLREERQAELSGVGLWSGPVFSLPAKNNRETSEEVPMWSSAYRTKKFYIATMKVCHPGDVVHGGSICINYHQQTPGSHGNVRAVLATEGRALRLTLSFPRVINVKFPLQPHQKITSHSVQNLAFRGLLRREMIILLILTTSLIIWWEC